VYSRASSRVGTIVNTPSIPDSSKILSTLGREQAIASRAFSPRLRLTPTSTPSAVEYMNVVSER
jgi:hypothetical protein